MRTAKPLEMKPLRASPATARQVRPFCRFMQVLALFIKRLKAEECFYLFERQRVVKTSAASAFYRARTLRAA